MFVVGLMQLTAWTGILFLSFHDAGKFQVAQVLFVFLSKGRGFDLLLFDRVLLVSMDVIENLDRLLTFFVSRNGLCRFICVWV